MKIKEKIKKHGKKILLAVVIASILAGFIYIYKNKEVTANNEFLPKESIYKNLLQEEISENIHNALSNIIGQSDYELMVHVNLNVDEITEEQIKYEPKTINSLTSVENLTAIPEVNTLPGLVNKPFHNETLPGFPSYFEEYGIEKDDFVTRGLLAELLSMAYQIPKVNDFNINIADQEETQFDESIQKLVQQDILKLYETGEFRPNEFINRAALITAIVRINYPEANFFSEDTITNLPYNDVNRNHWAYDYVKIALENKLIEPDILFSPSEKVSVQETLDIIKKTPEKSDIFNFYEFPVEKEELFKAENKVETNTEDYYLNQEKVFYKSPGTKIKNISIRLLLSQSVLNKKNLTIEYIEDIIKNTIYLDESRNDSLIIKAYRFTNLPILLKVYKWKHWQKIRAIILLLLLAYIAYRLFKYLKKVAMLQKQLKIKELTEDEKLAQIFEEEKIKKYNLMKSEIVEEADKKTKKFTLKIEKWVDALSNPAEGIEKSDIYRKVATILLFIDFEKPGCATKIIKLLKSNRIIDTINTIENVNKISQEETRRNIVEFYKNFYSSEILFGGKTASEHIIETTFDEKQKRSLFDIFDEEAFNFINDVEDEKIVEILMNENPITAAYLLNKCTEEKILEITGKIPSDLLKKIAANLIYIRNNQNEVMKEFEEELKDKLLIGEKSEQSKNKIQIQKASSVLETLPKEIRTSIFTDLEEDSPETLRMIQEEMFMFEDINYLNDVSLQAIIFEIRDMEILAKALMHSSEELIQRFQTNFSDRFRSQYNIAKSLHREVEIEDVNHAQYEIIRVIRHLEKNGRIQNLKETKRSNS